MGLINITSHWDSAHPHLRPLNRHLPLATDDHGNCPYCNGKTVGVLAHIQLGQVWQNATQIDYCHACDQFTLPDATAETEVTAVDARLWFNEPKNLDIEATTQCNFDCWYCVGRHMKQKDIILETFAKILDNCPSAKNIDLTGEGEPLLHKDFFTMARMAKDRGLRVLTISNGSAFSNSVVRKLCEAEIDYVGISVDSVNPATFAGSRIGGDLNKIWQGIERLRKYRDTNGYRFPRIGIRGTLLSHTINELPAIVEEAKLHGVDIVENFQTLNPKKSYVSIYPEGKISELEHVDTVRAAIRRDIEKAKGTLQPFCEFLSEEGIEFEVASKWSNYLRKGCDEQFLTVLGSGDVTPCCQVKHAVDNNWNVLDRKMGDILNDDNYQNMRFNLWNGLFPSYCEGCWKTS